MCKRSRDGMWPRVNKKNMIKWIGWSCVNVTLYIYILNQAIANRKNRQR